MDEQEGRQTKLQADTPHTVDNSGTETSKITGQSLALAALPSWHPRLGRNQAQAQAGRPPRLPYYWFWQQRMRLTLLIARYAVPVFCTLPEALYAHAVPCIPFQGYLAIYLRHMSLTLSLFLVPCANQSAALRKKESGGPLRTLGSSAPTQ